MRYFLFDLYLTHSKYSKPSVTFTLLRFLIFKLTYQNVIIPPLMHRLRYNYGGRMLVSPKGMITISVLMVAPVSVLQHYR
jgi:hypothetical protein